MHFIDWTYSVTHSARPSGLIPLFPSGSNMFTASITFYLFVLQPVLSSVLMGITQFPPLGAVKAVSSYLSRPRGVLGRNVLSALKRRRVEELQGTFKDVLSTQTLWETQTCPETKEIKQEEMFCLDPGSLQDGFRETGDSEQSPGTCRSRASTRCVELSRQRYWPEL